MGRDERGNWGSIGKFSYLTTESTEGTQSPQSVWILCELCAFFVALWFLNKTCNYLGHFEIWEKTDSL